MSMRTLYARYYAQLTEEQATFVDAVYRMCEENYERGGDVVVECFTPTEVVAEFRTLADVREYCGLAAEQALNARCGEDDDPQLEAYKRNQEWLEESHEDV